jgi:hypothetical protein
MPDKPYTFSTRIGEACAKQFRTFADLAEKLNMDVTDLMRECNGKVSPSKALARKEIRDLIDNLKGQLKAHDEKFAHQYAATQDLIDRVAALERKFDALSREPNPSRGPFA